MSTSETQPRAEVDFQAVARVARVVDLREVRLAAISANRTATDKPKGLLVPLVEHTCTPTRPTDDILEVECRYRFTARSADIDLAEASFTYVLIYSVVAAPESLQPSDVDAFAYANGTYHSWPFVRQLLFDLTSRMGFPPFTLSTFKFNPKPASLKPEPEPDIEEADDDDQALDAVPPPPAPKKKRSGN